MTSFNRISCSHALLFLTALLCMTLSACGGDQTLTGESEERKIAYPVPEEWQDAELNPGVCEPIVEEPQDGQFGWPCQDNGDCFDPFCIPSKLGQICTKTCIDECPEGFICKGLDIGGDVNFLCVDRTETLCMPCDEHTDCQGQFGGDDAVCLGIGAEGRFCTASCQNAPCPCGYMCIDHEGENGLTTRQCIPKQGFCDCSPRAIELQATTICTVENEYGACDGVRYCTTEGLTDCNADTPLQELCNGVDENCDGIIDNLSVGGITCPVTNEIGTCDGVPYCEDGEVVCVGDGATQETCNGLDDDCNGITDDPFPNTDGDTMPDCLDDDDDNDGIIDPDDNCQLDFNPLQENNDGDSMGDICDPDDDNDQVFDEEDCAPFDNTKYPGNLEVCDGKDNNCNGQIDEGICDDANDCTQDICDPAGGCTNNKLNGIPCNDGTVCSQVDICSDGECVGGNELNCNDGNNCTDDLCNPVTGCHWQNNSAACEDGNACTVNDICTNGGCISGTWDNCNDSNECTQDTCDPVQGCLNPPATGASCSAPSSDCPIGQCVGTTCKSKAGIPCTAEIDADLCNTVDVTGTCGGNGQCSPNQVGGQSCNGMYCPGVCVCCFICLCIEF